MATGFLVSGTDLSSLLAPIGSYTPISATGLQSGGTDLASIFAGASYGTAYGTTGFQSKGTDIGTLFAKLGSTSGNSFVIQAGKDDEGVETLYGYSSSPDFGSLVSFNLSFGTTVSAFISAVYTSEGQNATVLRVSASTDPGQSAFTTLTVTGTDVSASLTSASATSYSYSDGSADWGWNNDVPLETITVGDDYTVTLT